MVQGFSEPSETVLVNFVQKCLFLGKEALDFISLSEGSVILKMLRTTGLESYQPGTYGNILVTLISYGPPETVLRAGTSPSPDPPPACSAAGILL